MSNSPLILVPNPILKQKAQKVSDFGPSLRTLADKMTKVMRENNGMGLAAPQIGESKRMIVVEYEPPKDESGAIPHTILVNPTITDSSRETEVLDEGCLSIPGLEVPVRRSLQVNVLAENLDGKRIKIRAKDLFARILQHEIDHLNGILITEKAAPASNDLVGRRILFWGTPAHAVPYLSALAAAGADIVGVFTETDKPAGRGQTIQQSPVKEVALALGLPVFQPASLKGSQLSKQIKDLRAEVAIVVAYGKIIPQSLLDLPKYGFLNVHYSLLPDLRGPSPHQTAIMQGYKQSGYTIFKLDSGIDTGPILTQKTIDIDSLDTAGSLIDAMIRSSCLTLLEILPSYLTGSRGLKPQNTDQKTATRLFTKEDGLINWSWPADVIERRIRAMNPWPLAYTMLKGERLIIHLAHLEKNKLVLDIVQPAGKKPMSMANFINGNRENWLTFLTETGKVKLDKVADR